MGNALVERIEAFRTQSGLSRTQLAAYLGISLKTLDPWFRKTQSGYKPGKNNLKRIEEFLESMGAVPRERLGLTVPVAADEAKHRSQKLRYLLLLLEDELRWFREAQAEEREVLRKELNFKDVGYISSLLGMLGNEEMFQRWRTLTNYDFRGFREG